MRAAVKSIRSMLGRIADVGDVVGPLLLGDPAPGVVLDLAGEAADPAAGDPVGLLLGPPLGEQRLRRSGRPARPGETRCSAVYADQLDSPGPRPGIAPNRPTISTASRASASWSPSASASASCSRNSASAWPLSRTGPSGSSLGSRRAPLADQPREVDVEERVEGRPLALLLDQRRGVRRVDGLRARPTAARRARRPRRGPRPARPAGRPRAAPRGRRCGARPARCSCHVPLLAQPQLADRALLVGGVLEDDAERVVDGLVVEVADLERDQGARPVDGLGDRRRLLQLELAQPRRPSRPAGRPPAPRGRAPGTSTISRSRSSSG